MATNKELVKKFEELSGQEGVFQVREHKDPNGLETTQVWNTDTNSLVAECVKGEEDKLLADPQGPQSVDHRNPEVQQVEIDNRKGETVAAEPADEPKEQDSEPAPEQEPADAVPGNEGQ